MPVKLSEAKIVEQKPESIILAVTCNGENNNGEILKSVEIAGIIQRNNSIIKTFFLGKNATKDGIATVLLKLPNQSLSDLEIVANIENEANLVKSNVNDLINKTIISTREKIQNIIQAIRSDDSEKIKDLTNGLIFLNQEIAKELSKWQGECLYLNNLKSITNKALIELFKYKGIIYSEYLGKRFKILKDQLIKLKCDDKNIVYENRGFVCFSNKNLLDDKVKSFRKNGELEYEGEFKNEKYEGQGKWYYDDGNLCYEGEFKNNKFHGQGKKYWNSGKIEYEGEFKDDEPHGQGKLYYENGNLHEEGEFKNGHLNGQGKYYFDNGNLHKEGEFKNMGVLNGKIYDLNGILLIEGESKNNILNGQGKLYYLNGNLYQEGEFKNGGAFGKGKRYYKNGNLWKEGEFKNNQLIKGEIYNDNGELWLEYEFKEGELWLEYEFKDGKLIDVLKCKESNN